MSLNIYGLISLISRIVVTQARKFYYFRPDPHICYKYGSHNHLYCFAFKNITDTTIYSGKIQRHRLPP